MICPWNKTWTILFSWILNIGFGKLFQGLSVMRKVENRIFLQKKVQFCKSYYVNFSAWYKKAFYTFYDYFLTVEKQGSFGF